MQRNLVCVLLYDKKINLLASDKLETGFRAGKSCTSQLLKLTQHIDYQESMITGTAFVDLSAAYDTMNQTLNPETLQHNARQHTM